MNFLITPGPKKLDSNGKPFVQSRIPIKSMGADQSEKVGGEAENMVTEMKVDQNTANANGTNVENHGAPQETRQEFTSTQHGRGKWEYATRQKQPRYQTQNYNSTSQGFNHQGGFGGEGEDMRPGMQKFSTQRSGNGQYYNRNYPQGWNPRGSFHKGGGGK